MRVRSLLPALCGMLAFAAPLCAQTPPPLAPAYIERDLAAIGQIATERPLPGAVGTGGCTGTLITPTLVLTAAHCAATMTGRPQDLFVTFGWREAMPPAWRSSASEIRVAPGYDPAAGQSANLDVDLALIVLPRPVPNHLVQPLPLHPGVISEGPVYSNYGYLARNQSVLRGSSGCHAARVLPRVLGFDCDVVRGFSGGPLLVELQDGRFAVVGVAVAVLPGRDAGLRSLAAIPGPELFPQGLYPAN